MSASHAVRLRRSALFVPACNDRALAKAAQLDADVILYDLEDSVAPDAKTAARSRLGALLRQAPDTGRTSPERVIRVNSLDTPWCADDLAMAAASHADAVLIPKVERAADLQRVLDVIDPISLAGRRPLDLWIMIETPCAILDCAAIAEAGANRGRLAAMVIGPNDLALATRVPQQHGRSAMLSWLSMVVLAARAHGLDVLDGVYAAFSDMAGFRSECEQGRDFGMDGKTLIHPSQIAVANAVFSPDPQAVAAARRIVAAFAEPANHGRAVIALDGRMVELLHAEMATRLLALADAVELRQRSASV